jgi:hypothetical protein
LDNYCKKSFEGSTKHKECAIGKDISPYYDQEENYYWDPTIEFSGRISKAIIFET